MFSVTWGCVTLMDHRADKGQVVTLIYKVISCMYCLFSVMYVITISKMTVLQVNYSPSLNAFHLFNTMLGYLENAKIGNIQYLCYGDECWYLCRSTTATFRKNTICWSRDLICINFLLMYW